MQAAHAGPRLFEEPYQVAPHLNALANVPIDVWSTKGFLAAWQGTGRRMIECESVGLGRQSARRNGDQPTRIPARRLPVGFQPLGFSSGRSDAG